MITTIKILINLISVFSGRLAGLIAFKLFFMPAVKPKMSEEDKKLFSEANKDSITINGKNTSLYEWGNSDKVVLIVHGWESRASQFSAIIRKFIDSGYKVVSFDAPSHGWSEGRSTTLLEFCQVIEHFNSKDYKIDTVVAHSFGTVCAGYS